MVAMGWRKRRIICNLTIGQQTTTSSGFNSENLLAGTGSCAVGERYETSTLAGFKVANHNIHRPPFNLDLWLLDHLNGWKSEVLYFCFSALLVALISVTVYGGLCFLLSCY